MEYYRPGPAAGAYAVGPELGEDGLPFGALDRGFRPGGDYARQPGYGGVSAGYINDGYERTRPPGGEYLGGGASEFYGAQRPGRYGNGREGYASSVYDQGYPPGSTVQPPFEYLEAEASDLGMGLRDAGKVSSYHSTDYGAGYGRPELLGYGSTPGYGSGVRGVSGPAYGGAVYGDNDEVRRLRNELEHERRRKHELEAATAAALGYGLHERRGKSDAEDELDEGEGRKKEKSKLRQFFSRD